ncbi:Sulfatases-like protein [Cyclobacterium qasimii M12-11B]|uniref:Sulfatases-like protein n=1 Tax=Cyclobacterium qasimii M12-11B TaxID=641524 RepID=S7VI19_9BACT|nr:Sulfatases-like protein [Cyclobacterium qasimii M12-11B]
MGFGAIALSSLIGQNAGFAGVPDSSGLYKPQGLSTGTHFPAKAKRVIYLFQSGGPSQIETFDYKPSLEKWHGKEIPPSVQGTQRNSGMVADQSTFPLVKSIFDFKQYGDSGAWVSEIFPHTAKVVDDLCIVKSMITDAINHEPAVMFMQTGSQLSGRPSIGSWLSYGLGSDNENLPNFVVLLSKSPGSQPLNSTAWGNGFLPSHHQGIQFRSGKDPVLYLNNPHGVHDHDRRRALDHIGKLNEHQFDLWQDPEIQSKISQYEMAYKMQNSVPEAVDTSKEPDYIYELYGEDARIPGTYASNCLQARKLAERDVKFIQLYHMGWDQHGSLPSGIKRQALSTDQATAGLIQDLKQRGLLEDTLVVWGGEFGRTSFSQGRLTADNYGRDHHPGCFTMWMAGAGVKKGMVYGETDEFSYNVAKDPVHVHDFQATLLHLLGIDHEKLTFKHQGRRFRLTDVHGQVIKELLV